MAIVNKFNVNNKQVTLDADIIENMSANDVPYNSSFQYNKNTVGNKLSELEKEVIYDVTVNNDGVTFASLSELLSAENLSTLIPVAVRCGGMSIRFVQSSDNKYVQARLMAQNFTTDVTQWQRVDDTPISGSDNLVKSGGVGFELANPFVKSLPNYYINTRGVNIGDVIDVTPKTSSIPYRYSIVPILESDIILISGTGGEDARLWAFVDSTYHLLSVSNAGVSANSLRLTIPSRAAYLIINDSSNSDSYLYRNNTIGKKVYEQGLDISSLKLNKALAIAYSNGYLNADNITRKIKATRIIKVYYNGQYLTVAEGTEVAYRLDSNESSMYAVCVNPSDSTLEILGYADEARQTAHPIIATYKYGFIQGNSSITGFISSSINVSIDNIPFDGASFNNRFLNVKKSISNNKIYIDEIIKDGGFSLPKSEPHYYIKTGISLGSIVDMMPLYSSIAYCYSVFHATHGDTFKIYGIGGSDARLWAFVDSTYHLLSVSKDSAICNGDIISAPENTAYLIINDSSGKKSYYNEGTKELLDYCKNTLDKIYDEIQFIDGIYYNVTGSVGDTATLEETSLQNYKSVKLSCDAGDTFIVNATAGGGSAKPYTFIDSNNVILANSGSSSSYYGVITAPNNTAYVIIETNTKTLVSYASKDHMLIDTRARVLKIELKNIDFSSIQSLGNDGVFNSFELSVPNDGSCSPMIVSAYAKYTTNGSIPTIRFSIGTLFTSIPYTIGGNEDFSLKEWRVPPMLFNTDLKIIVNVPEGCTLTITDFSCSKDRVYGARQSGVMLDAHLGFQGIAPENSMIAFELAAQCGYQSCIVTPITSADGTIYCYHEDDATLSLDGITSVALSAAEFAALTDDEIAEYKVVGFSNQKPFYNEKIPTLDEFFYLCSKTGMRPMFSTHPAPTDEQWQTIKSLLVKYRLIDKIIIKAGTISILEKAYSVLGNIRGFIYDVSGLNASVYCQSLDESTLSNYDGEIGIEYMVSNVTQAAVETTLTAGYFASVWSVGRISGERYKELISWGVSEFTDDFNCSNGLNW